MKNKNQKKAALALGALSLIVMIVLGTFTTALTTTASEGGYDQQKEPTRWNPQAQVEITGFMGYNDPFSRGAWNDIIQLYQDFGENIKFVFRNYPLEFQDPDYVAAQAGECVLSLADEQTFFKFSDIIMELDTNIEVNKNDLIDIAETVGQARNFDLDISECLKENQLLPEVLHDIEIAQNAGLIGSPIFYINRQELIGDQSYQVFYDAVKRALVETGTDVSISEDRTIKIDIKPGKQNSENGEATYKVILKDLHPTIACVQCIPAEYTYQLFFSSRQGVEGKLEQNSVTLNGEETIKVDLAVKAEKKGANIFTVTVKGRDGGDTVTGVLLVGEGDFPEPQEPYFIGEGFAVSNDETIGHHITLSIRKDNGNSKGKIRISKENYQLNTIEFEDNNLEFEFFKPGNDKSPVGYFKGMRKDFSDFSIMQGDLEYQGMSWDLIVFGKKQIAVREISTVEEEAVVENIQPQEIISIVEEETEDFDTPTEEAVYIRPIGVKEEKFLGIFPKPWSNKKVIEVEVIEENKVAKKTIKEFDSTRVGNHEITIGSLQDENNIEISVRKTK